MKTFNSLLGFASVLLLASSAFADELVDGTYKTVTDGSEGSAECTLVIQSTDTKHKYGDATYTLESSGTGACNWSAVGVAKSYAITGGMITNGGASAFMKLTFPFGPAGKRIEITALDLDGTVRNKELFAKQ
ncbi:MAG: hypothetical protein EXR84_01540 [Gammaproteobacteria bacterium]|nr:hypothetical protein [Gammaproteobacteria bacterium]